MKAPPFVNRFTTEELIFPTASVIGLNLSEAGPEGAQSVLRCRMTTSTARRLAQALLDSADELDGRNQPRQ
jgi:hypothetical protein